MDQSCRDIPMRLDVKHQPLNFDIYLSQVIDVPKTSIDDPPYNFQLELEALEIVDRIIERTTQEQRKQTDCEEPQTIRDLMDHDQILTPTTVTQNGQCNSQIAIDSSLTPTPSSFQFPAFNNQIRPTASAANTSNNTIATKPPLLPPSCPIETPLTPVKCFIEPNSTTNSANSNTSSNANISNQENNSDKQTVNQINPKDFEEIHYNPFDHLELQTIDELRELDLVFQASYANQASKQ